MSEILSKETFMSIVQFRYNEIYPTHHNVLPPIWTFFSGFNKHCCSHPATHPSQSWLDIQSAQQGINGEVSNGIGAMEGGKRSREDGEASACVEKASSNKLEAPLSKPVVAEGTAGDELDDNEDEQLPENASDEDEEE
ncbi:hypothetical protein BDR04DRAFT_1106518 [Suillus decipiens]|nr:hypothetical protein BDR04DRAFT_1106518 [Suillus decipiens]